MRKIIVSALLTVDGLISSPDHEISWAKEIINDEMLQELKHQLRNADTLLLGRITCQLMQKYCTDPANVKEEDSIVHYFNQVNKVVFSKTLTAIEWNNAILLSELNRKTIRNLQHQGNGDIAVIGSTSIIRSLINMDLVNEFHFFVHPLVLGKGNPLFHDIRCRHALTPVKTDIYKNGVLRLCYQAFTVD